MSNKTILSILLVIAAAGIIAAYFVFRTNGDTAVQQNAPVTFPSASDIGLGSENSSGFLTIDIQNDKKLVVKDFLQNSSTLKDPANEDRYLLAGSLNYCASDVDCVATEENSYTIFFDTSTNVFSVGLLEEPLGETRRAAERFLAAELGIPLEQLCALKYYIGTTYLVNEKYAGDSVGFSMCEGAVSLPQ